MQFIYISALVDTSCYCEALWLTFNYLKNALLRDGIIISIIHESQYWVTHEYSQYPVSRLSGRVTVGGHPT